MATRIKQILIRAQLPINLHNKHSIAEIGTVEYEKKLKQLTSSYFLELMSMDKKVNDGLLSLILLKGNVGNCIITEAFNNDLLTNVVEEYCGNK